MKKTFLLLLLVMAQLTSFGLSANEGNNGDKKKKKDQETKVQKTETEEDTSGDDDDLLLEDDLDLGSDFRFEIDGEINANAQTATESKDSINFDDSFVSLSATWKNKIRGVITLKLEEIFKQNKVKFNNDFSIQEFIKEAYIEVREVAGKPIAVIVGKQPIPFGQNVQAMPIFNNNPLADLQEIDEVYGLTVELTEGLFGVFDRAEVAVFESEGGDLELGKIDGVAVRLDRSITENWLATFSYARQGNDHIDGAKPEQRVSLGLIGETTDGALVGWVEGMYFSNNPKYPNSKFAITAGGMMRVHETTDVIIEYSFVEKEVHQFAVGLRTALTSNLTLGAEVRYNNYVNDRPNDVTFGISLTYAFGSHGRNLNDVYLLDFDKDDE